MIRQTIYFQGDVQGVGFRATARHIARGHCVAGYVQNMPDGRVRLVAEGEAADVRALVQAIRDHMGDFIRDASVHDGAATGEFGSPAPGALRIRH